MSAIIETTVKDVKVNDDGDVEITVNFAGSVTHGDEKKVVNTTETIVVSVISHTGPTKGPRLQLHDPRRAGPI